MTELSLTPLRELCDNFKADIVDGPFGANLKREHYKTEGIPVLKIQNIKSFKITLKKMDYVDDEKYQELIRHSYRKGDIVMTKLGDPLGESAIVENIKDGLIVADLVRIRAQKVDTKYLCYHLNSPVTSAYINSQQKGTTRPRVRISVVRDLPIYTPPLAEQKRIVAILDQAFADIEQARAKTEKNLKNARELFESYLQQVFSQRGQGWVETTLENLVTDDCSLSYGIVQPGDDVHGGMAVVRPTDMKKELINLDGLKLIDPVKAEGYQRTKLKGGELLVCVRGSTGITSIACKSLAGANVTRGIVPVRFDPLKISDRFGYYQFISPLVQTQIKSATYGAALMQINIRDFRKIILSVPTLEKQTEIANKLDEIAPELKKVERIYDSKISALDELKKSILQKAFAGELTKSPVNETKKGVAA